MNKAKNNPDQLIGEVMDIFESYLAKDDSKDTEYQKIHLAGNDYDKMSKELKETLVKWGVLEGEN